MSKEREESMMKLEARVKLLEDKLGPTIPEQIWIHIVGFGQPDRPVTRITLRGQEWKRCEGESEEAFRQRAETEAVSAPVSADVFVMT
jgi:hypothetical protein